MSTLLTRRRLLVQSGLIVGGAFLERQLRGQKPGGAVDAARTAGATAKIESSDLRGGVTVLSGSGGNVAVLSTGKEKLCVDSGLATSRVQMSAAIAALGPGPSRHLLNTHWHFDHTDGNEWMHGAGAQITAHENTLKRLSTTQHMDVFGATFPPSPRGALPTATFRSDMTMKFGAEHLKLRHYSPAHTDSDISIRFENADILHTGDTWFNGLYPFIDYSSGGSIDGMIEAAKFNFENVTNSTLIVPGHGPVGTKVQLKRYAEMLMHTRDEVQRQKSQGKLIDDVIASHPTKLYDAEFSGVFIPADLFVRLVYMGV